MPRRPVLKPAVWSVPAFRDTVKAFELAAELATGRRPLSLITAPAGSGKTFTAEWYCEQHRDARLAVCPPRELLSARSLLEAISRAISYPESHWRVAALFDNLAGALSLRHTFLILDEADRLTAGCADMLRELADNSDIALCFLGCPGTLSVLARVPATHHRVGFSHSIPPVALADVQSIYGDRYDEATLAEIYEVTGGNLRHLEAIPPLLDKVRRGGEPVPATPKLVRTIAQRFLLRGAA